MSSLPVYKLDPGIQAAVMAMKWSPAELAKALGITRGAIHQWKRIPAGRVLDVERVTGVSRQVLRPDLYPSTRRKLKKGR